LAIAGKMSYMSKIWKLKMKVEENIREDIISNLSLNPHPNPLPEGEGGADLLAQLLYNRGLTDKEQIEDFLEPKYENLHSPFKFLDMEKAVERIWRAIDQKEKICIYGDYDADAITANAVLAQTFKYLGVEVTSYIPDRFTEGYGVNLEALSKIINDKSTLIITVDCGTNSIDAAEFCAKNNVDLIITDHHEIIGDPPKAYALINPKNPGDNYPYREITGVGVAFKLACGILSIKENVLHHLSFRAVASEPRNPLNSTDKGSLRSPSDALGFGRDDTKYNFKPIEGWEKWLLDLVAIGTVADCHSLLGENRILVKYGLKVLAKTKWIGLRALMESAGLIEGSSVKPLDTYTLGFIIAPRLNAAGRLEHAGIALDLLMETDPNLAREKAQNLEAINARRQGLTASVLSEAREKVLLLKERKVLALVGEGWPKGIMGLVAGKLAEEFYKPAIVLERTDELCTGSARTAGEFNILEALKFSSEHLSKFGGHKQAAGLSLRADQFEGFYQKLLAYADQNIGEEKSQKVLELEAELALGQLSIVNCQLLRRFEPFGVDNIAPKFLISNLVISSTRLVGKQGQHLQLQFKFNISEIARRSASDDEAIPSYNGIASSASQSPGLLAIAEKDKLVSGIMFNAPDFAKNLKIGDTVDAAAELIEDNWNGNSAVKLRIADLRVI
jgi:single-stranded-DNA-specific exonuclease